MIFTAVFWKKSTERAIKTLAQVVLSLQGAASLNVLTVDWGQTMGVAAGAVLLSYATSVVSATVTKHPSPDLLSEEDKNA